MEQCLSGTTARREPSGPCRWGWMRAGFRRFTGRVDGPHGSCYSRIDESRHGGEAALTGMPMSAGRWRLVASDGAGGTGRRSGHAAVGCLALVLLVVGVGCATPTVRISDSPHTTDPGSLECGLPDSLRVKMLEALTRGDVIGAIGLWRLHTGREGALPRALQAFQEAFNAANRIAGPCERVARDIHEGFKFLGGTPRYARISSTQGPFLTWQGRVLVSDNKLHRAVRYGERIYDAFTGPAGMLESEYRLHMLTLGSLIIE
jgi:hypothetical protein